MKSLSSYIGEGFFKNVSNGVYREWLDALFRDRRDYPIKDTGYHRKRDRSNYTVPSWQITRVGPTAIKFEANKWSGATFKDNFEIDITNIPALLEIPKGWDTISVHSYANKTIDILFIEGMKYLHNNGDKRVRFSYNMKTGAIYDIISDEI